MNTKRIMLFIMLITFSISNFNIIKSDNSPLVVGLAATSLVGLGLWTYKERSEKNKIARQLAYSKSEEYKVKLDRELLADIHSYIEFFKRDCSLERKLINKENNFELLLNALIERVNRSSLKDVYKQLQIDAHRAMSYKQNLEFKINLWEKENNKTSFLRQGKALLVSLEDSWSTLQKIISHMKTQMSFLKLCNLLSVFNYQQYNEEIELYQQQLSSNDYNRYLEDMILTRYSESRYQFPHVTYLEDTQKSYDKLNQSLFNAQRDIKFNSSVHMEVYIKVELISNALSKALKRIALSNSYLQEKENRPFFEKEQKLVEIQIKEKEAKIIEERRKNEIRMQQERNRKKELENQRKEQELRDRDIKLSFAKIKDGENIRKAIKDNDKKWAKKLDKKKNEYERRIADLERRLLNV